MSATRESFVLYADSAGIVAARELRTDSRESAQWLADLLDASGIAHSDILVSETTTRMYLIRKIGTEYQEREIGK